MDRGKLPMKVLALLMVSAMLAGCGALIVGGAGSGGHDGAAARGSDAGTSDDAAITASITSRYLTDPIVDALTIRVSTYDGVVTIQGSVKSQDIAMRAVALARATPHVRRVVSRLTVAP
jgi:hyperosmotically inducible protein